MNGLCRELMAELPAAGAATAKDYMPEEGERHAGNHGQKLVTLFGEIPEIRRTYYYSQDGRRGHYPFDDRLGLVGRYTPDAAQEAMRHAVRTPYAEAAEEYSRHHGCRISADTVRGIVGMHLDPSTKFCKDKSAGAKEDASGKTPLVCVMADGTGLPMRKACLRNAKGKDGAAKTREVKTGAIRESPPRNSTR